MNISPNGSYLKNLSPPREPKQPPPTPSRNSASRGKHPRNEEKDLLLPPFKLPKLEQEDTPSPKTSLGIKLDFGAALNEPKKLSFPPCTKRARTIEELSHDEKDVDSLNCKHRKLDFDETALPKNKPALKIAFGTSSSLPPLPFAGTKPTMLSKSSVLARKLFSLPGAGKVAEKPQRLQFSLPPKEEKKQNALTQSAVLPLSYYKQELVKPELELLPDDKKGLLYEGPDLEDKAGKILIKKGEKLVLTYLGHGDFHHVWKVENVDLVIKILRDDTLSEMKRKQSIITTERAYKKLLNLTPQMKGISVAHIYNIEDIWERGYYIYEYIAGETAFKDIKDVFSQIFANPAYYIADLSPGNVRTKEDHSVIIDPYDEGEIPLQHQAIDLARVIIQWIKHEIKVAPSFTPNIAESETKEDHQQFYGELNKFYKEIETYLNEMSAKEDGLWQETKNKIQDKLEAGIKKADFKIESIYL
ncbi:Uncharacterized protein NEOC65_001149 [Neochlamydia sp. AcF65]|uniref:hypothetical protein n=1 Tax=Neochlamydia sp. AcF65 TaxID=2795735 RepID=UPI001BC958C5|nr:hypothetical protein [Neochlamydia sp. AcF65]MBS4166070.1 Uncharacterized protein [Neochlamydia sp. AcF65]